MLNCSRLPIAMASYRWHSCSEYPERSMPWFALKHCAPATGVRSPHLLQFGGLVLELRRIGEHIRGQTGQYFLALVGRQRLQHFSPLFGSAVHDLAHLISRKEIGRAHV